MANLIPCTVQAFDQHLNMVLGEVEETAIIVELGEEGEEDKIKVHSSFEKIIFSNPLTIMYRK